MEEDKSKKLEDFLTIGGVFAVIFIIWIFASFYFENKYNKIVKERIQSNVQTLVEKNALLDKIIADGYEIILSKNGFKNFRLNLSDIIYKPGEYESWNCENIHESEGNFITNAIKNYFTIFVSKEDLEKKKIDTTECNNLYQQFVEKSKKILIEKEIEIRFVLEDEKLLLSENTTEIYSAKLKEINTNALIKLEDILKLKKSK